MASNYMAEYEKWLNSDVLTAEEHAELLAIQDDPKEIESRFYGPLELECEPGRGYCYTALLDTQEALLMAYCAGGAEDGGCLNRLRIRRIEHSVLASALGDLPAMND